MLTAYFLPVHCVLSAITLVECIISTIPLRNVYHSGAYCILSTIPLRTVYHAVAYCILSTIPLRIVYHSVAYCILSTTLLSAERHLSAGSYAEYAEGKGEEE